MSRLYTFIPDRPLRLFSTYLLLVLAALAPPVPATGIVRTDKAIVEKQVDDYLTGKGRDPADYFKHLTPFGEATWLISVQRKAAMPVMMSRYASHPHMPGIKGLDCVTLALIFRLDYPSPESDADRTRLMNYFITLNETDGHKFSYRSNPPIISSTSDIPGYERSKLAPDLHDAVRAPFNFDNATILYTYNFVGGIVRRYEFEFKDSGELDDVWCMAMAYRIGGYMQLE